MPAVRLLCVAICVLGAAMALFNEAGVGAADESSATAPLRHVVFFKFKAGTAPADLKKVTDAFAALPSKIDVIKDFEWGTDVSVENLSKGFTHCFFVTFADEKGRDAYLPHPAHKEFVEIVKPLLDDVCVVDYHVRN
ncbi:MAG: Dabb family protein [Planctomycetaceae bacterium]|nr:Dabb family protein [Planctomycetaceae bacterium]